MAMVTVERGPVGNTRSIPLSILWAILTLGIYTYIWVFKTHDEIKQYSGNGVGGWLGFLIYFVFSPITWFLVPSEVRYMYEDLDGGTEGSAPVRGIWGLWFLLPHRRTLCLVHQGAGRPEPLLGIEGRSPRIDSRA